MSKCTCKSQLIIKVFNSESGLQIEELNTKLQTSQEGEQKLLKYSEFLCIADTLGHNRQ